MFKILIIGIIIVLIILVLSIMTINKGYAYKHYVDKLEDNPYTKKNKENSNMLRILRITIALTVFVMSAIGLYTGQNNFLPLSQFLLGALMFLIAFEQIKKKEAATGLICIISGAFIWIVLIISYIK